MAPPDHYAVLRVAPTAPREAIRKAYLRLAREHHPDVAGEAAHDRMQRINAAWQCLSDDQRRQDYDRTLPRARFRDGAPAGAAPGAFRTASRATPGRKNWRPVGVPWEEPHADWYAYFNVAEDADAETLRAAIGRRRSNAEAAGDQPWAVRMRGELDRVEAVLMDPVRRAAYNDEMARIRAQRENPVRRAASNDENPVRQPNGDERQGRFSGDPTIDWYSVIGVRETASEAEIRRALEAKGRSLAAARVSASRYALERAQLVKAAQILTNPATRAAYDAARATLARR